MHKAQALTAGLTFAIGQFAVSNYMGTELTGVLAALFSLGGGLRSCGEPCSDSGS